MKRFRVGLPLAFAAAFTLIALPSAASKSSLRRVGSVDFPTLQRSGEQTLPLRGAARLKYLFFKVCAVALYADPAAPDVLGPVHKKLVIHYLRDIPAKGFRKATRNGIADNVSRNAYKRLEPRIEQLNRLYRSVKSGSRYTLAYQPGKGTTLSLDGKKLGTVAGDDFARALFSIWLGPKPVDKDLRHRLLGKR